MELVIMIIIWSFIIVVIVSRIIKTIDNIIQKNIKITKNMKIIKNVKITKNMKITRKLSNLYKMILVINEKYNFYLDVHGKLNFETSLKSKRSLDNLSFAQYIMGEISENLVYYETLFTKVDKNRENYLNYTNEYIKIEKYMTAEEFLKLINAGIKYKTFNKYEKKIYQTSMLTKPIMSISADCHATYTSPSGRNSYWRDSSFNFNDLKLLLKEIEGQKEYALLELQRKQKAIEEKRAKDKKLRELDKIEEQLTQKEQEMNEKENEFKKATQGHIYSSQNQIPPENNTVIEQEETPYQKLKKLKTQYENNEISRAEYEEKRKALL
ncbi:MAG: hypothetical protein WCX32_04325 [Clostridia bacterium]|jgi:hypothetical protein